MTDDDAATVAAPLDPGERLLYGADIDEDLGITDRGRRKMIVRGVLPRPNGYIGTRAFWTAARYAAFKAELLAGKHGRVRRPGAPAATSEASDCNVTPPKAA